MTVGALFIRLGAYCVYADVVDYPSVLPLLMSLALFFGLMWLAVLMWNAMKHAMVQESPSNISQGRSSVPERAAVLLMGGGALYFGSWRFGGWSAESPGCLSPVYC